MIKNINVNPASRQRGEFTSVDLEQFARYKANGLTYVSDNINIIPRNTAGDIIIQQSASMNELLIIEPMVNNISTKSVLRVIDTSFQYYKFPVSTIDVIDDVVDLDIELDIDLIADTPIEIDTISTRYTIPYKEDPAGIPNGLYRLSTSYTSNWFTSGGAEVSGFVPLPFTGANQLTPMTFTVTPDMIDTMKTGNKTIRFFIRMQILPYDTSINTGIEMRLMRRNSEFWSNPELAKLHTETLGDYNAGIYAVLSMEYILDINNISEYDTFSVEAQAGMEAWYLGENTVWRIELIDVPENGETGVISISDKTSLELNNVLIIDGRE
jgi:hypothetical protein